MKRIWCMLGVLAMASPLFAETWTFDDPTNPAVYFNDPVMGSGYSEVRIANGNGYVTVAASAVKSVIGSDGVPVQYFPDGYGIYFAKPIFVHAFNIAVADGPGRVWPEGQKLVTVAAWSQSAADPSLWQRLGQVNLDVTDADWLNWRTVVVDWPGVKYLYVWHSGYQDANGIYRTFTTSLDNITGGVAGAVQPSGAPCRDSPEKNKGIPGGKPCIQP